MSAQAVVIVVLPLFQFLHHCSPAVQVLLAGYKVPADATEGPKNLEGKNAALAQDDADLEPAREKFSEAKAKGDTEFKSVVAEEHSQAQHGGSADQDSKSQAAKLKEVRHMTQSIDKLTHTLW